MVEKWNFKLNSKLANKLHEAEEEIERLKAQCEEF